MKRKLSIIMIIIMCSVASIITASATTAIYDHVVDISDNIFIYEKDGKYGFMDANGEALTAAIYDGYSDFEDGCSIVTKDGLYGVINTSGKEIISTSYDDITYIGDRSNDSYTDTYYSYYFRVYKEKSMQNGVICGLFDLNGNIIRDFSSSDELLMERYIDSTGFYCSYIKDENGNILGTYGITSPVHYYNEGYCAVADLSFKYGIVDMDCNTVIPFIYEKTYDVNSGLAKVKLDGKYGFINMNNEIVVPIIYDDASDFTNGIAYVKYGDKYGFVNTSGEIVIDLIYDSVSELFNIDVYDNTVFEVYIDNKLGFVTSKNLQVTDIIYSSAMGSAKENIIQLHIWVENKHSFVNLETGELISDFIFANIYDGDYTLYWSSEGVIATSLGIGQYGYLSKNGDVILDFKYGFTYAFNDGYGKVRLSSNVNDETYGYVDSTGNIVVPFEYSSDEAEYALYEYIFLQGKTTEEIIEEENLAAPTNSTVLVDGEVVSFEAYNIDDNNYFKLRDVAYILNGTAASFEVTWNGTYKAIELVSGSEYTIVGGEMSAGDGSAKEYKESTASLYLDGETVSLTAYTIDENNYFKLRDIAQLIGFNVSWDSVNKTIVVNSSETYTED